MSKRFGFVETPTLLLEPKDMIPALNRSLTRFSYDFQRPPDFRGLFEFIVSKYTSCTDPDIVQGAIDILANVAGYKLGVNVADIFATVKDMIVTLISSHSLSHLKSAVDYFRKVSRALGPRAVINAFIAPNSGNAAAQRGLAVIAHQIMTDSPGFNFLDSDFGSWVDDLSNSSGGQRLSATIAGIRQKCASCENDRLTMTAPIPTSSTPVRPLRPTRAIPHRLTRENRGSSGSICYSMTQRQQSVRNFVDEPYPEASAAFAAAADASRMRDGVGATDWEDRSAAFNTAKRLLRYAPGNMSDDDVHAFVTAAIEDVGNQRAALALAAIGALEEGFRKKGSSMEFELGRVAPVLMRLTQKTGQFFEEALDKCFEAMIGGIPAKRLLGVLIKGDLKSSKVQAAIARYCRDALQKCVTGNERMFAKGSAEITELVEFLFKMLTGASPGARDAARDAARLLSSIYGDDMSAIVSGALEPRQANEFMKVAL